MKWKKGKQTNASPYKQILDKNLLIYNNNTEHHSIHNKANLGTYSTIHLSLVSNFHKCHFILYIVQVKIYIYHNDDSRRAFK